MADCRRRGHRADPAVSQKLDVRVALRIEADDHGVVQWFGDPRRSHVDAPASRTRFGQRVPACRERYDGAARPVQEP